MNNLDNFNEFLNEARKYGTKEKQRFIEKWDVLFDELGIDDKKEQDRVVRAFDKLEGDNKTATLVEVISLSLDKAKVGFSYNKLENFYQQHIYESLNEERHDATTRDLASKVTQLFYNVRFWRFRDAMNLVIRRHYNRKEQFQESVSTEANEEVNEDWYNKPNNYNDAFNRCIEQLDNILRTNVREYMIDQKDTIKSNNKEIKKIIASLEKMRKEINK